MTIFQLICQTFWFFFHFILVAFCWKNNTFSALVASDYSVWQRLLPRVRPALRRGVCWPEVLWIIALVTHVILTLKFCALARRERQLTYTGDGERRKQPLLDFERYIEKMIEIERDRWRRLEARWRSYWRQWSWECRVCRQRI